MKGLFQIGNHLAKPTFAHKLKEMARNHSPLIPLLAATLLAVVLTGSWLAGFSSLVLLLVGLAGPILLTILALLSPKVQPPEPPLPQITETAETEAVVETEPLVVFRLEPESVEQLLTGQATLELAGSLAQLVARDTEEAVLNLSESLFALLDSSRKVSNHIEQSLVSLTDGDAGMGKMVPHLNEHLQAFERLGQNFDALRLSLEKDLGVLSGTVGAINEFSENISDLADQTNVLAINASIEAARVGINGKGFAVIANQVQSLSRNSKTIAEKMAATVQSVVQTVESSYGRQTERIQQSRAVIHRSEVDLRQWSAQVAPQLAKVEQMIHQSRSIAALVTTELDRVTVSLQFQDRIRQILEHLEQLTAGVSQRLSGLPGLVGEPVTATAREDARKIAEKIFTIDQEWALTGKTRARVVQSSNTVELF